MKVNTVRVVHPDDPEQVMLINESDYEAEKHRYKVAKEPVEKKPAPKKGEKKEDAE